jgi:predicted Zn-dependent peptidase
MVISHYFSKGGQFYQRLYADQLIDSSFNFSTNLERNFGYSLINSNTNQPEQYAEKVKELLLSTNKASFTAKEFETMKRKKIGQLLRAMNSLEYIASQYIHYHTFGIDFFTLIPSIQALSLDDVNSFVKNWIKEDYLSVCKIVAE